MSYDLFDFGAAPSRQATNASYRTLYDEMVASIRDAKEKCSSSGDHRNSLIYGFFTIFVSLLPQFIAISNY